MSEIWILGATGRSGRAVAAKLAGAKMALVLVGRDLVRLRELAATLGGDSEVLEAGSVEAIVDKLSHRKPAVVINTIGPFVETALPIARACSPETHYVDISNELFSFTELLALHDEAVAAGKTWVRVSVYFPPKAWCSSYAKPSRRRYASESMECRWSTSKRALLGRHCRPP